MYQHWNGNRPKRSDPESQTADQEVLKAPINPYAVQASALLAGFGAFVVVLVLIAFVPAFLYHEMWPWYGIPLGLLLGGIAGVVVAIWTGRRIRKNFNSAIGPGT